MHTSSDIKFLFGQNVFVFSFVVLLMISDYLFPIPRYCVFWALVCISSIFLFLGRDLSHARLAINVSGCGPRAQPMG